METYLSLLALVCLGGIVCGIQFEDDSANLEHSNSQRGFFPASGETILGEDIPSDNRKQLNFNSNSHRYRPQAVNQNPYRPKPSINSPSSITVVRKRPHVPYQFASNAPANYYTSYPTDLSNPFYQNYAQHYQYPAAVNSDYLNPTRHPSAQPQPLHQPSLQYPNYYTNNYANQFGYQRPSPASSPLYSGAANFLNNIRETSGPFGQISQVGGQFGKALEDISANDDLQCVPKVLCQMVKSARKPNQLPSFLNIPGLSALISALPSSSPLMNFGRATLLGISPSGECDTSYPRCPRDEEQMLHYLNNHRGGFFRFFNGGNSFGEENQQLQQHLGSQQQHTQFGSQFGGFGSQQQQQYQQQGALGSQQQEISGASQGLNLLTLQALADTLSGQGSGLNLGNLLSSPSNQRPAVQPYPGLQADQSQSGIGSLLGMLKPSGLTDIVSNLLTGVVGNRFSRRLSRRSLTEGDGQHRIEKRIVNVKPNGNFFEVSSGEQQQQQNTLIGLEEPLRFSNDNRINGATVALKFPKEHEQLSQIREGSGNISPSDVVQLLRTLFPGASGHLRLDNDQFNRELLKTLVNERIGKILTGVQQYQPAAATINRNQYQQYKPSYAGNYDNLYTNRDQHQSGSSSKSDRSQLVYITNSRGQTEYTLNEVTGEKKRIL